MKLWLNEKDFIEINEKESLATEIAPRSRSLDWLGLSGFLPDPDPVLRKLGQDISVYRELLSDAHVWSCYQSRKSGTLSCEWEINESEDGGSTSKRAYNLVKDIMKKLKVRQVIIDMLDAPFFGMSPVEVVWESLKGKLIPNRVVGKPPEWFIFNDDNEFRFRSRDNMTDGEEIPEYRFLLPRHHATYKNPYGERILSRCFWPVTFKRGGFKFWSIFTEKFGMPWIVGKVPRGTNEPERAKILSMLVSMVQDAVAVINDDESIEMPETGSRKSSADIYDLLISAGNRECSKAILGQTLSTELDKGGSLAATKGHLEVRQDLVDADKQMVKESFDLLFKWITELNFAGETAPTFDFQEEEDVQKERAERDKSLNEQGVRFTKKYYGRVYNLEDDDFEIDSQESKDNSGQFAEETAQDRFSQENVDRLSIQGAIDAQGFISALIDPVLEMIDGAESYDQIINKLYGIYPDMDKSTFRIILTRAIFASALTGYAASEYEEKQVRFSSNEFAEVKYGNLPFNDAIEFFRDKGITISPESWRDVWQQANLRAFTVARVTAMDVLVDIRNEVDAAISEGKSLGDFKKELRQKLENKGWFAPKGEKAKVTLPDGSTQTRLTGWRIENIYRTNLQTAYSVGRYKQMNESVSRVYWQYMAIMDAATRPDHGAQNGKVYHRNHPFWDKWYPPNGFDCRCYVKTLSARQMEQRGLSEETGGVEELPDEGWRYNPGQEGLDKWQPDLSKYPEELKEQYSKEKAIYD